MPVKRWMIFGPCQETSYTAITLNPESNFTRREMNHSLFHWSTLTFPELHTRIWMSSKRKVSIIIGISMGHETCQILGQVSHNLLYWKKNLLMNICGPGGDWRENCLHPGQIIYGQKSGKQWEGTPSWRRSKNGRMRSSIWKTHENCEGSISLTRRMRNSKRPPRMPVRSWKHQLLLLCLLKLWRRIVGVVDPTKLKQDLRVFWKPMNPRDCVWENHYQIIMKTILQEKETINSLQHYKLVHKFIPMPQAMKIPAAKSSGGQGMGKIGENFGVESDESQKQERGDWWSKDVGRESSFCIIYG